jgi:hypothetical protein
MYRSLSESLKQTRYRPRSSLIASIIGNNIVDVTPPLEKRCPLPLKGNEKETAFRITGYAAVLIPLKVP